MTRTPRLVRAARRRRLHRDPAALVALGLGLGALLVAALRLPHGALLSSGAHPAIAPLAVCAAIAAGVSYARRERDLRFALAGVGMTLAASLIGWLVAIALVAIVVAFLIILVQELL